MAHAGKTIGDAQRAGFTRVAEGAADLRGEAEKLAAMLSTAAAQVTPGQAAAAEASAERDPEAAVAKLTVTVSAVDTAHGAIAEAVQKTRDLESRVAQVLRGAQTGPLLGMLGAVRAAATQAVQQGQAAKQHAESGIAQGRQISAGGSGN